MLCSRGPTGPLDYTACVTTRGRYAHVLSSPRLTEAFAWKGNDQPPFYGGYGLFLMRVQRRIPWRVGLPSSPFAAALVAPPRQPGVLVAKSQQKEMGSV